MTTVFVQLCTLYYSFEQNLIFNQIFINFKIAKLLLPNLSYKVLHIKIIKWKKLILRLLSKPTPIKLILKSLFPSNRQNSIHLRKWQALHIKIIKWKKELILKLLHNETLYYSILKSLFPLNQQNSIHLKKWQALRLRGEGWPFVFFLISWGKNSAPNNTK